MEVLGNYLLNQYEKMLTKLIKKTNEADFYNNYNLKLETVNGKIESHSNNTFELDIVLDNDTGYSTSINENWKIIAHQVIEVNGIFRSTYLPYTKLCLLDEHPLLWKFKYDQLHCILSGDLKRFDEFTSKLHWLYEKHTGGFISWRRDFWGLKHLLNDKKKISVSINTKTYDFISQFVERFGLTIEITEIWEGTRKGFSNRPEAKILFLGNPDVCPNNLNLGQPFIIADDFTAVEIWS